MWWNKDDKKVSYISYQVNETEVLVGPRLDRRGCSLKFFNSVNGWLVVTESFVEYPILANVRWFPWKELAEKFPDHVVYGSLKTLNHWINELKLKRIYIHCDLGSHRAPTVLGAFLAAYYPEKQDKIIANRKVTRPEASASTGSNGKVHAEPDVYFEGKVAVLPLLPIMIRMIVEHPTKALDEIVKLTFDSRPFSSFTEEEKEEYYVELAEREKKEKNREWLAQLGFNLEGSIKWSSFHGAKTPKGLSHVIGDQYFPEMLESFKQYGKLYLTSEEGRSKLSEKLPDLKPIEVTIKDDLVLYYYELDLNSIDVKKID